MKNTTTVKAPTTIKLLVASLFLLGGTSLSAQSTSVGKCFDALIIAEITAQVPSVYPESRDGQIVMSWPYFIDLDVERVLKGTLRDRKITALSVQHTFWRDDLGKKKWWVRRNSEGIFNLLRYEKNEKPIQCKPGAGPDRAYLVAGNGRTLNDLRREGEVREGKRP
jgi:hypothetical protein